jgi:putative glycosyltransferase (TIGR04372 family)
MLKDIDTALTCENFELALDHVENLLEFDPNNSELLKLKFNALVGLDKIYCELGFLRKLCWYRSSDEEVFWFLSIAFEKNKETNNALISLAFGLSCNRDNSDLRAQLNLILDELGYSKLRVSFVTSCRIGHLASEPEAWIRQGHNLVGDTYHLFLVGDDVANTAVLDVLSRYLKIHHTPFFINLHKSRPRLISEEFYQRLPYDVGSMPRDQLSIDKRIKELTTIYNQYKTNISLTNAELEKGQREWADKGIDLSNKIVCLHVRDSAYLEQQQPNIDFSYHSMRDASLENYVPAIKFLANNGYTIVRLGHATNQRLSIDIPGFIDACNDTSDLMELVLYDKCEFFLGTNSGPLAISAMLDKPTLLVNCAPAVLFYAKFGRCIYKTLWKNKKMVDFDKICKGLTIDKVTNIKVRDCYDSHLLSKNGFEYIENTSSDILDAVIEFHKDLVTFKNGEAILGPMQRRFLAKVPKNTGAYNGSTIPTESFLERYASSFVL